MLFRSMKNIAWNAYWRVSLTSDCSSMLICVAELFLTETIGRALIETNRRVNFTTTPAIVNHCSKPRTFHIGGLRTRFSRACRHMQSYPKTIVISRNSYFCWPHILMRHASLLTCPTIFPFRAKSRTTAWCSWRLSLGRRSTYFFW